jgi:hypothetical protein
LSLVPRVILWVRRPILVPRLIPLAPRPSPGLRLILRVRRPILVPRLILAVRRSTLVPRLILAVRRSTLVPRAPPTDTPNRVVGRNSLALLKCELLLLKSLRDQSSEHRCGVVVREFTVARRESRFDRGLGLLVPGETLLGLVIVDAD